MREPGGVETSEAVRALVKDPALTVGARAEALLYAAARAQLVEEALEPTLERGEWVLLDRFVDSSLAYQGGGRELGVEAVRELNLFATGGLTPDRTLLLTLDPASAQARADARGGKRPTGSSARATSSSRGSATPTWRWPPPSPSGIRVLDASLPPAQVVAAGAGGAGRPAAALSSRSAGAVAVRVRLGEGPGVGDHRLELGLLRLPAELVADLAGRRPPASAGRRGGAATRTAGIVWPVTFSAAAITSRTEKPLPLPRLKIRCSPARACVEREQRAPRRGRRCGCSRAPLCRRASGSRCRRSATRIALAQRHLQDVRDQVRSRARGPRPTSPCAPATLK